MEVGASTGSPSVTGNTIIADNGDEKTGIRVNQAVANAIVSDNEIGSPSQGFDTGIEVLQNSSAEVTGNTVQGLNQRFGSSAKGIRVNGSKTVTISRNVINSPIAGQTVDGVYVESVPAGGAVSLDHNRITGLLGQGAVFADSAGTLSMEGDVIAQLGDRGFYAGGVADLTIENATIVDVNSAEVNTATVRDRLVDPRRPDQLVPGRLHESPTHAARRSSGAVTGAAISRRPRSRSSSTRARSTTTCRPTPG